MTETRNCLQCRAELPPHFPPGVCPACLLKQGMSPSTLTGAAGDGSGGSGSGSRRGWIPPTVEELSPKFPQWEIVALLGQGGMGAVYKVRQRELDRWAALKVLPDEVASDPNFAERFQREARTLAQLSHQHIVTVYEFGQREGVFYLLMEFVDGVTLRQAIRAGLVADAAAIRSSGLALSGTALSDVVSAPAAESPTEVRHIAPSAALGIVGQICDALQFAHEEGIVHRDIKPENILIDKRGRVKIADFGLAKLLGKQPHFPTLTGTHQIMGTPVYMAPEQMEGTKGVDHRADIFSLGVVFYELLTGELPLGRFAPPSQKYALDVRLDEIVLRTLEKEPGRRYQQASDVKCDVETLRSRPAIVTKQPVNEVARSIEKLVTALLSIAFGIAAVFGFIVWSDAGLPYKDQVVGMGKLGALIVAAGVVVAIWGRLRQPATGEVGGVERPRSTRSFARLAYLSSVIAMGTFVGLAGCVFFLHWVYDTRSQYSVATQDSRRIEVATLAQPSDVVIVTAAQKEEAIKRYVAGVEQQKREQHAEADATRDPVETNAVVRFTADKVKLHPQAFGSAELTSEQRATLEKILTDIHQKYLKVEADHSEFKDESGTHVTVIGRFDEDLNTLENDLWTAVDSQLPVAVQKLLRDRLPLYADSNTPMPLVAGADFSSMGSGGGGGMMAAPPAAMASAMGGSPMPGMPHGMGSSGFGGPIATSNLRYQQLFGWSRSKLPMQISIGRRGKWFIWTLKHEEEKGRLLPQGAFGGSPAMEWATLDRGEAPELPSGLKRFWHEDSSRFAASERMRSDATNPPTMTEEYLDTMLIGIDKLRAADQTPWAEVEQRTNELLALSKSATHNGRIHWMAAHVYGQSDIRGHGADVIRHAKEALKYERDPVQRGWLYMYLGDATGLVEKKEEAARWYLKGYLELLPYQLPDKAPELPAVNKIGGELRVTPEGEADPDQIASEVVHAAQMKARKDAEFIRELVSRRDIYIGQLQNLFGRKFADGSDEAVLLKKIAEEMLREEALVGKLLLLVRPEPPQVPMS